jgi:hypothetical protein
MVLVGNPSRCGAARGLDGWVPWKSPRVSVPWSVTSQHVAIAQRVATAHSDLGQSLLVIVGFLVLLSVGLLLAVYLEPGTQAKPLALRRSADPVASRSGLPR